MERREENRPAFMALGGKSPENLFSKLPSPCYVIEEGQLLKNAKVLAEVMEHTGCKILLAQKAFSNYDLYDVLKPYLAGTEASGLYEARLGAEEMPGKEVHVFCAAYREDEFEELLQYADHIVFNSVHQLQRFGKLAKAKGKSLGLRINPECSTQEGHEIYDPCAPGSRLGVTRDMWNAQMTEELLGLLDGLHFHTLCEQDADALEVTLDAVETRFGDILPKMKWLNMGGGHHITRPGYDVRKLNACLLRAKETWKVQVYLEPGEAIALNAGFLVSRVLDVVQNGDTRIAILDASAACHMPDVIEMPYLPPVYLAEAVQDVHQSEEQDDGQGSGFDASQLSGQVTGNNQIYRLAGPTCLAGDVIGDYCFLEELHVGDMLLFGDMAIYTTCKNNTFNGMQLPNIWKHGVNGTLTRLTDFGYEDFKMRLGSK